ncbi:hypothetical protein HYN04_12075 [Phenylobacterium parvum]|uniref:Uncharacterized protein n=2 Tax=Phenylobacterium parvum TaxID=2201350 RepID=A0A2Z3HZB3_9CAUL|nr:hypothetical protein HYN04_12075 [Phenylobacterium parvum]
MEPGRTQGARGPTMSKLVIENLSVRIAAISRVQRRVSVTVFCRGPGDRCAAAVLKPRRHIAQPADGLWNIDLLIPRTLEGVDPVTTRELHFTGDADWCQGVRLHADGVIMEHRLAEHEIRQPTPARLASPAAPRIPWAPASAALSVWLDPDRPPMIIPAGRPVPRRPRKTWPLIAFASGAAAAAAVRA